MKLFLLALCAVACSAAKLDNTYLPPSNARSAGGNGDLISAPRHQPEVAANDGNFRKPSDIPTPEYGVPETRPSYQQPDQFARRQPLNTDAGHESHSAPRTNGFTSPVPMDHPAKDSQKYQHPSIFNSHQESGVSTKGYDSEHGKQTPTPTRGSSFNDFSRLSPNAQNPAPAYGVPSADGNLRSNDALGQQKLFNGREQSSNGKATFDRGVNSAPVYGAPSADANFRSNNARGQQKPFNAREQSLGVKAQFDSGLNPAPAYGIPSAEDNYRSNDARSQQKPFNAREQFSADANRGQQNPFNAREQSPNGASDVRGKPSYDGGFTSQASGPFNSEHGGASGETNFKSNNGNIGEQIPILKYSNENNGDGSYQYEYETANGIQVQEESYLKNAGTDNEINDVRGSYSYTGDDGQQYTVTYIANENGFQPQGTHIQVPLPTLDGQNGERQYSQNDRFNQNQNIPEVVDARRGQNSGSEQYNFGLERSTNKQYNRPADSHTQNSGDRQYNSGADQSNLRNEQDTRSRHGQNSASGPYPESRQTSNKGSEHTPGTHSNFGQNGQHEQYPEVSQRKSAYGQSNDVDSRAQNFAQPKSVARYNENAVNQKQNGPLGQYNGGADSRSAQNFGQSKTSGTYDDAVDSQKESVENNSEAYHYPNPNAVGKQQQRPGQNGATQQYSNSKPENSIVPERQQSPIGGFNSRNGNTNQYKSELGQSDSARGKYPGGAQNRDIQQNASYQRNAGFGKQEIVGEHQQIDNFEANQYLAPHADNKQRNQPHQQSFDPETGYKY